jgi:steroid 5-alpha reductase family enzyme
MFSVSIYASGLIATLAAAAATWVLSLRLKKVSIVDSLWSLLFVIAAFTYAYAAGAWNARTLLVLTLVTVWALRLSVYITWRNWGHGEDPRYQAIRARNEPNFAVKSLYLVFGLQAVLAWIISLPTLGAILGPPSLTALDAAGTVLWAVGVTFEAGGDWQLARFKSNPANRGRVMDRGFWQFTRHPNYFGDFCVWWGLYLIAAGAGAWWSFPGPLGMSVLLLKVSGVTLLESDIAKRRPEYVDYIKRTNAFFPGPRKRSQK